MGFPNWYDSGGWKELVTPYRLISEPGPRNSHPYQQIRLPTYSIALLKMCDRMSMVLLIFNIKGHIQYIILKDIYNICPLILKRQDNIKLKDIYNILKDI